MESHSGLCTDIDECEEFKGTNLCNGICENTPGSYACKCPAGYKLGTDNRTCKGIISKAKKIVKDTKIYWLGNQFDDFFLDIDECASGQPCQDPSETCVNTGGSFRCIKIDCPDGYYRDDTR